MNKSEECARDTTPPRRDWTTAADYLPSNNFLKTLQTLQALSLSGCTGLLSLPDLSGLAQLEVEGRGLPDHLQPWKASGYQAFSLTNEA